VRGKEAWEASIPRPSPSPRKPQAVQEKGDLNSYHLEKWILKHVFMSQEMIA